MKGLNFLANMSISEGVRTDSLSSSNSLFSFKEAFRVGLLVLLGQGSVIS